ncbi:MAG TPA: ABC transporter permease, partial [Bryobacteraceae bacterium]|nr:ABC transporter permease [Bryobacteraceae bacterium]
MAPGAWLAHITRDVSHGFRMLWKNPGFTCATMLTLALGIGANTAIFSVVDTVLLRPLPYKNAERLMVVWEKPPRGERNAVSPANFLDWREQARSFEHLAAVADGAFNLSLGGGAERISGIRSSWNFFAMLGVAPALGR